MRAFLWLAAQGYEVFDNVFPNGPVDVVAMDRETGELLKFEVRTATLQLNGKRTFAKLTPEQTRLGVKLLAYKPELDEFEVIDDERAVPSKPKPPKVKVPHVRYTRVAFHERKTFRDGRWWTMAECAERHGLPLADLADMVKRLGTKTAVATLERSERLKAGSRAA